MRALCISKKQKDAHLRTQMYVRTQMGVRALWAFFFCLFFPKKNGQKKFHTQKSTLFCFFLIQKNEKEKERKKNVHRAAAAARFFSARQPLVRRQHPVVDHRRGVTSAVRGRDERRDPNRACLRGRLLSLRWSFFFYSSGGLSLLEDTTKRALPKRATTMAIKIEIAPIHSMTKKTTMMDSRIQSSPKEARDATSPDHPLSLSRRETTTTT